MFAWCFHGAETSVSPWAERRNENRPDIREFRVKNGQTKCLIPLRWCASLAKTWRGLTAPPAGRFEKQAILLKGMSAQPEAFFKVDRWS